MKHFVITHYVKTPDHITEADMRRWVPKVVRPSEWPEITLATVVQTWPEKHL